MRYLFCHDTKLPGEDGEDEAVGWGTMPSPKAKPFEEDPGDTLTRGWGNKPNPGKDPTSAHGSRNKPNPKKKSHVCRCVRRNGPGKVYTYPVVDEDQTRGHGDTTDR